MDAGNWIALVLGLGTLILGGLNTYAQWHTKSKTSSPRAPVISMVALTAIVIGAVGYDIYDRHHQVRSERVLSWGGAGTDYHMTVSTRELQDKAKSMRLMLIVRPVILGADPVTDVNIGKSGLYTIAGPVVTLTVPMSTPLRMIPLQPNLMEYNIVLLPVGIGPERIRTLADVTDLGGSVFEGRGTSVMAGPALLDPASK
jgi:hypothetical protein